MAPEIQHADEDYCDNLVRQADDDRWLAIHYAGAPMRRSLLALAALRIELRRIPDAVSEPPLGEIRLQWWREALGELRDGRSPRAHPVVGEIAAAQLHNPAFTDLLDAAIDARARPLYDRTFESASSLEAWLADAEARFDKLAILAAGGDAAAAESAFNGGLAFALARETPRLAPSLWEETIARTRDLYRAAAPGLRAIKADAAPAALHLALTPLYLRRASGFAIRKRMRLFTAMMFAAF